MRNFQHRSTSLVNSVQGIVRIERYSPPTGIMLNIYKIVAKNHFRGSYSQLTGHIFNGTGLKNRQLLCRYGEPFPDERLRSRLYLRLHIW